MRTTLSPRRCTVAALLAGSVLFSAPAALADITFRPLGSLDTRYMSRPTGISPDGSVVVGAGAFRQANGHITDRPVRWIGSDIFRLSGFEDDQVGGGSAEAASSTGAVIVGGAMILPSGHTRAVRTAGELTQQLPMPPGFNDSYAYDVTPHGHRIVGSVGTFAAVWDGDNLPTLLPHPTGASLARATAVSADGGGIVGSASVLGVGFHAAIWPADGVPQLLPLPDGYHTGSGIAISGDGSTVLYTARRPLAGGADSFVWTGATGSIMLERPGDQSALAYAMSADGSTIVGVSAGAVMWRDGELINVHALLSASGVDLTGWNLVEATAVSDDGLTIAGLGRYQPPGGALEQRAWVITIPGPGAGCLAALGAALAARRRR